MLSHSDAPSAASRKYGSVHAAIMPRRVTMPPPRARLAVIADGTFEYEVCDGGRELAVTLLRATGWLSRRRLPLDHHLLRR